MGVKEWRSKRSKKMLSVLSQSLRHWRGIFTVGDCFRVGDRARELGEGALQML